MHCFVKVQNKMVCSNQSTEVWKCCSWYLEGIKFTWPWCGINPWARWVVWVWFYRHSQAHGYSPLWSGSWWEETQYPGWLAAPVKTNLGAGLLPAMLQGLQHCSFLPGSLAAAARTNHSARLLSSLLLGLQCPSSCPGTWLQPWEGPLHQGCVPNAPALGDRSGLQSKCLTPLVYSILYVRNKMKSKDNVGLLLNGKVIVNIAEEAKESNAFFTSNFTDASPVRY